MKPFFDGSSTASVMRLLTAVGVEGSVSPPSDTGLSDLTSIKRIPKPCP